MKGQISDIVAEVETDPNMETLEEAYKALKNRQKLTKKEKKLLAEICYLIALNFLRENDMSSAEKNAIEAISIYEEIKINTLEDAAPILWKYLPDIMHENVVKVRILENIKKREN